ncbi:MAG: PH domain-containing protein, partial [Patescibacteria group bacterium]|nr:PH domain-containing protein [Patescibacteria group bacterium]
IGLFVAWLEYRNYAFRFEEFDLAVRRGVISTETVSIPYRQIQDLNIQRDLIYQILGLSRLVIDSAGHEEKGERNETDIILEPLYKETAEEIRGFLERRIGVQVVIDEKEADREAGAA